MGDWRQAFACSADGSPGSSAKTFRPTRQAVRARLSKPPQMPLGWVGVRAAPAGRRSAATRGSPFRAASLAAGAGQFGLPAIVPGDADLLQGTSVTFAGLCDGCRRSPRDPSCLECRLRWLSGSSDSARSHSARSPACRRTASGDDAEAARQYALDVAIEDGGPTTKGKDADRCCCRAADPRQSALSRGSAENVPARSADDGLRTAMQVARPRVIAQPGPQFEDALERCMRQVLPASGSAPGNARNRESRSADLRLLQHDLGEPDAVRVARLLPRQVVTTARVLPGGHPFGEAQGEGRSSVPHPRGNSPPCAANPPTNDDEVPSADSLQEPDTDHPHGAGPESSRHAPVARR
jgi:hypothetical protein